MTAGSTPLAGGKVGSLEELRRREAGARAGEARGFLQAWAPPSGAPPGLEGSSGSVEAGSVPEETGGIDQG